jgi:DNA polymerase-1
LISTGDKDMAQLVDDNTLLVNTMTDMVLDIEGVKEKFGVPPELIIDYLALMGDSADNIPGAAGVGNKTAVAMLQGVGSMDDIYNDLDALAPLGFRGSKTIAKKMVEHEEMARLSYQLATIKCDVELDVGYDDFKFQEKDKDELIKWFGKFEFRRWLSALLDGDSSPSSAVGVSISQNSSNSAETKIDRSEYKTIYTKGQLIQWIKKLEKADLFAFDTETTSLDYMQARVVGMSFAIQTNSDQEGEEPNIEAAYLPLAHDYMDIPHYMVVRVLKIYLLLV